MVLDVRVTTMNCVSIQNNKKKNELHLNDSWGEWDQLHPLLLSKLSGDNTKHTGTKWLLLLVQQNAGVIVKADISAIGSAHFFLCAHNNSVSNITLLDLEGGGLCSEQTGVDGSSSFDNANNFVACKGPVSSWIWHSKQKISKLECPSLPSLAYLPPLITLMHSAMIAPELSMTLIVPLSPIMIVVTLISREDENKLPKIIEKGGACDC